MEITFRGRCRHRRLLGLAPLAAEVGVLLGSSLVLSLHFSHLTTHATAGQGNLYAVHTVGLERRLKRGWFVAGGLNCALFLPLPFSRRPGQNGARAEADAQPAPETAVRRRLPVIPG